MDPFSHAIVGAMAASLGSKTAKTARIAALCGVVAGMFPDIDVLIRETDNPMFGLGMHRHFTHALVFVPFGAAIVAGFLWLVLRRKHPFMLLYLFSALGMVTHGILDSLTNYGTHLLWPLTNQRESWSIISIIDPIFTFTLLGLLIASVVKRTRRYVAIGAVFAFLYLGFGYTQREAATSAMFALANSRGQTVEYREVKPALANMFVWRAQYIHQGKIYTDAIHVSPWRGVRVYEGSVVPMITTLPAASPTQARDMEYFQFFSDGWLAYAPNDPTLIADMRFAGLPNTTLPLWGIKLQPDKPDAHVLFESPRTRSAGDIKILWQMIKGEDI